VYVINQTLNQNAGTLVGYSIGTNTLTPVTGSPQTITTFIPVAIAVNHANTMLFVAGGNIISTFTIGSGGALSPLYSNTLSADEVAIDVSPDGQWLLALESTATFTSEARIDEFQINSSGQLSEPSVNPAVFYSLAVGQGAIAPSAIKFAPNGQLVFLALGTAGDLVYGFTTSSGALTTQLIHRRPCGGGDSEQLLCIFREEQRDHRFGGGGLRNFRHHRSPGPRQHRLCRRSASRGGSQHDRHECVRGQRTQRQRHHYRI
jgi:hypothetical protein